MNAREFTIYYTIPANAEAPILLDGGMATHLKVFGFYGSNKKYSVSLDAIEREISHGMISEGQDLDLSGKNKIEIAGPGRFSAKIMDKFRINLEARIDEIGAAWITEGVSPELKTRIANWARE
jgi:hypothetical protein